MSSLMGNHGIALATATAMAVSGTVIVVALCRQRPLSATPDLRSCIASGSRKVERRNSKKKKKRVRFGEDVIVEFDDDNQREELVETTQNHHRDRSREYNVREMPANRAALYSGIMRSRLQRMECY